MRIDHRQPMQQAADSGQGHVHRAVRPVLPGFHQHGDGIAVGRGEAGVIHHPSPGGMAIIRHHGWGGANGQSEVAPARGRAAEDQRV